MLNDFYIRIYYILLIVKITDIKLEQRQVIIKIDITTLHTTLEATSTST